MGSRQTTIVFANRVYELFERRASVSKMHDSQNASSRCSRVWENIVPSGNIRKYCVFGEIPLENGITDNIPS